MARFVARLVTPREMERGVKFYGPDQSTVLKAARAWLERDGKPGDRFDIVELREMTVLALAMTGRDKEGRSICK